MNKKKFEIIFLENGSFDHRDGVAKPVMNS